MPVLLGVNFHHTRRFEGVADTGAVVGHGDATQKEIDRIVHFAVKDLYLSGNGCAPIADKGCARNHDSATVHELDHAAFAGSHCPLL